MSLISEVTGEGQGLATRFSVMALIVGGAAAAARGSAALGMLILLGVFAIGSRQSATS